MKNLFYILAFLISIFARSKNEHLIDTCNDEEKCSVEKHPKIIDFKFDLHQFLESIIVDRFEVIQDSLNLTTECLDRWILLKSHLVKTNSDATYRKRYSWAKKGILRGLCLFFEFLLRQFLNKK